MVVEKWFDLSKMRLYVNKFMNSEQWKERSCDDEIVEYLIEKWIVKDFMSYNYAEFY